MTKQDIIEYVMHTPHNTNRAVLSSMLNQLAEGDDGGGEFDTARVTFINSSSDSYDVFFHEVTDTEPVTLEFPLYTYTGSKFGDTKIFVIDTDEAFGNVDTQTAPIITGDIEFKPAGLDIALFCIRGNGTITVAGLHNI